MKSICVIKKNLILCSVLFLTSCSLFSPVKTTPPCMYRLDALPCDIPIKKMRAITLFVMPPDVVPAFNTTQIAFSIKPHQIGYYGLNRWVVTPGQMFYPLLIQTLQNTHFFHAIVNPPCVQNYDYILCTQILELLFNYSCEPPLVQFVLRAQVIKASTGKVIATKMFFIDEPILEIDPYAGVIAANCATKTLLREIAKFTLKSI